MGSGSRGWKERLKRRIQSTSGTRDAQRALRRVEAELGRLHRRLDGFDQRQHQLAQMLVAVYPRLGMGVPPAGPAQPGAGAPPRILPAWKSVVFEDPEVGGGFELIPPQKTLGDYARFAEAVTEGYEEGKVIVLEDVPIACDRAFLSRIEYPAVEGNRPQDWATKELTTARLLEPYREDHPLSKVFGSPDEARRYQDQVRSVNEQLLSLASIVFPAYRFQEGGDPIQWRFALTCGEDFHLDTLKHYDELHRVRMFFNIDSMHRVWSVGPPVDVLLERYGDALLDDAVLGEHPDRINLKLSLGVYGGLPHATHDLHPRHVAFLAPGSVWFGNTSILAHQVLYGRRAVLLTLATEARHMHDPEKSFFRRVRRWADARRAAGAPG